MSEHRNHPRKLTPNSATFTRTGQQHHLSRPLEDCEGCPVLAGVRNLGLDESQRGCSDLHCNFGVRSSRAASSGCMCAEPGPLKPGCTGRTVRRAEWQALAEGGARGGEHAPDTPKSKRLAIRSLADRCHAPCQPCQAGRRSHPRLRRRQCPKRPVRQLQSLLRHTGERTWKSTLAAPRC